MSTVHAPLAYSVDYAGCTFATYHADKGQGIPRHEHWYPHLTMCHAGSCVLRKEGIELVITKSSQPVNLIQNEWHEIEALEDGTVFVNVFMQGRR
jgi:quercetin dioxygenase-like cupin family protein